MPSLVDHDIASLEADLTAAGHKPVHAVRILRRFYENNGYLNIEPLGVSRAAREYIEQHLNQRRSAIKQQTVAADGTRKLLIGYVAGGAAEAVLMPSHRQG